MAVIYLSHPVYGNKVATLDLEAEADEKNGWVRYTPEDPPVVVEEMPNFLVPKRKKPADKEA